MNKSKRQIVSECCEKPCIVDELFCANQHLWFEIGSISNKMECLSILTKCQYFVFTHNFSEMVVFDFIYIYNIHSCFRIPLKNEVAVAFLDTDDLFAIHNKRKYLMFTG
ncbi:unnamed protein product [Leptidea sinapis]|uniref:Uncharacterized protein n=1 Tax=Leptidea sinapis TaxID=189913 RepID=A0A5E4QV68_9NEOP|nr:unnamed protein product [Leptidea sinapis]